MAPQTESSAKKKKKIAVLVVPFPAQGHLNQLLHLSLHLSSHGLSVHFASSSLHILQAQSRLHSWPSSSLSSLSFHPLPLPPIPTPPPSPSSLFPSHLQPLFSSLSHFDSPLSSLLLSLSSSSSRLILIHDPLIPFPARFAHSLPNTQIYKYLCTPAFYHLSFHENNHRLLDPIPDCFTDEFLEFRNSRHYDQNAVEDGYIINSCLPIEEEFIELLRRQPKYLGKRVFAVGPIHPLVVVREEKEEEGGGGGRHECLRWMDQQPENSVLYVAFGTTCMMTDHQIKELAMGLEKSGQRFIWVLRDADGGDVFTDEKKLAEKMRSLPEGYEERIEGMGMVVRGWAPQLEILAHKAIGAFMSHCGWNSCMESLSFGVPMLAWPMHSDQPRNAMAVTEYLKVGVMVRDWDHRKEVVKSMEIVKVVKRLMVSDEGMEMRKRALVLGEQIRVGVSEGGSSWKDLNSFISHITTGL